MLTQTLLVGLAENVPHSIQLVAYSWWNWKKRKITLKRKKNDFVQHISVPFHTILHVSKRFHTLSTRFHTIPNNHIISHFPNNYTYFYTFSYIYIFLHIHTIPHVFTHSNHFHTIPHASTYFHSIPITFTQFHLPRSHRQSYPASPRSDRQSSHVYFRTHLVVESAELSRIYLIRFNREALFTSVSSR